MSSARLSKKTNSRGADWEDLLAVVGVLALAGTFVWYQVFADEFPRQSNQVPTELSNIQNTLPPPVVHINEQENNVSYTKMATAKPSATHESFSTPPKIDSVEVVIASPTQPPLSPPVLEIQSSYQTMPVLTPPPTAIATKVPGETFNLERNIQTNLIDFSGNVNANSRLRLVINGTAGEVIYTTEEGVWMHSQQLEAGFHTFELQLLNNELEVTSSTLPKTYEILPINQSSGNLPAQGL